MNVFYKGINGLEYRTPEDAEIYGGGLVGKMTVEAPKYEEVELEKEKQKFEIKDLNDNELRMMAKELGVKSWHLLSHDKLVEKIESIKNK